MTTQVPRHKSEVIIRHDRGRSYPALNVKVYGFGWNLAKLAARLKCSEALAEQAANLAYESAQREFWDERAADCLNFAMLGELEASEVKPAGLKRAPFQVYSDGRSGGWLIVEGLPDVTTWNAVQFGKWRKFARLIRAEIRDLLSFEQTADNIEANNWHQTGAELYNFIDRKDGTHACLSEMKAAARAAGFGPVVRP